MFEIPMVKNNVTRIECAIIITPAYKVKLIVPPEFVIYLEKKPNAWHRFWLGVLLGWKYQDIHMKEET